MNVNADTAAAALAAGIGATDLVLVTDVPGLMREFEDTSVHHTGDTARRTWRR